MKKSKKTVAIFAVALIVTLCGANRLLINSTSYSSLTQNDVEALSACESRDGYVIQNCQGCKGKICRDPSGEFHADDCTYIYVQA